MKSRTDRLLIGLGVLTVGLLTTLAGPGFRARRPPKTRHWFSHSRSGSSAASISTTSSTGSAATCRIPKAYRLTWAGLSVCA
jgi:hypothetical protein